MQRYQLEHAVRAAREITSESDFVVIGSAALLASLPDAPAELTASLEVDIYPRYKPEAAETLNAIGEFSLFHETHGFWVDPVGPDTAILAAGWERRLVPIRGPETHDATAWCLELYDLAVSKLFAGREKDLDFLQGLISRRLVEATVLGKRIDDVPVDLDRKTRAHDLLIDLLRPPA